MLIFDVHSNTYRAPNTFHHKSWSRNSKDLEVISSPNPLGIPSSTRDPCLTRIWKSLWIFSLPWFDIRFSSRRSWRRSDNPILFKVVFSSDYRVVSSLNLITKTATGLFMWIYHASNHRQVMMLLGLSRLSAPILVLLQWIYIVSLVTREKSQFRRQRVH